MNDVTLSLLLLLLAVWLVVAVGFALCAGRMISTADRKEHTSQERDDRFETSRLP